MTWSIYLSGSSERLTRELQKIADAAHNASGEVLGMDSEVSVAISGHFDYYNSSINVSINKAQPPVPSGEVFQNDISQE